MQGTPTPWSFWLVRLLFKFVLKIFYGTIVVEGAEFIPKNGQPCIVCANHSNSLTDALLLVTSIPSKTRGMLRLTAKSTQFGHRTFTSWLIESAGTVPIKRRKDFVEGTVDNSDAMEKLLEALEAGDAICLFPEGMSRYHPTIAPLKTGVARIISDFVSRNRIKPDLSISLLNCSITYMHRQHFRSDVLVTFHPPMTFSAKENPELLAPVEYSEIRKLTHQMHQQISAGTIDSPSWELIRVAKLAARMYAPLGTHMSLGDHVRVVRAFLEAFKATDMQVDGSATTASSVDDPPPDVVVASAQLRKDLKVYQDQLAKCGIKDDRIRRPLPLRTVFLRILIRFIWFICLFTISLPGLVLWLPVFATTFYATHNFKKTGPIWDTWDELAQYKLIYGLMSGLCVWFLSVALTLSFASITILLVPALMWMTLRWFEDAVSALRALFALGRLLRVGERALKAMYTQRADLHSRIMNLAVQALALPEDPEEYFARIGGREKGRVQGRWESGASYFSVRRRRKRDWNETLRLYDKVDYPEDMGQ